MKHRSRTEIVVQILEVASKTATETKMMYEAFLSHNQLKDYIAALESNGLISYDEKTRLYRTTDRGFRLLRIYHQTKIASTRNEEVKT
jgi:predicted transcriptional regulator